MRKGHLCTIFKLYVNSFCRQRAWLEVLKEVTALPIFLLYLSLTSQLWPRPWLCPIIESPQSFSVTSTLLRMR